jgi:hypothetical protein
VSKLAKAKQQVMAAVPYLQKTSSRDLKYTFAGEADLIGKLRPAMLNHGISVSPTDVRSLTRIEGRATKSGQAWIHVQGIFEYTFTHESGEIEVVCTIGEAQDLGDKACNKAMTIGLKYALRQFFLIETGDDPDVVHDAINDEPIADYLRKAIGKIKGCKSAEALSVQMERIREAKTPDGDPLFSDDQLAELDRMADRHLKEIK